MVGAIQTFGDLIHWHPPNHALVSEGVFLTDGTFLPLPKLAIEPFLKRSAGDRVMLIGLAHGQRIGSERRNSPPVEARINRPRSTQISRVIRVVNLERVQSVLATGHGPAHYAPHR